MRAFCGTQRSPARSRRIDRLPGGPGQLAAPAAAANALKAEQMAEIRHAIRNGHWADAGSLVVAFGDTHPDDPEAARLAEDLAAAKDAAGREVLARLDAAREANDPDRVIELRDELKPLIEAEALRTLDRDLAKWFLLLIHRRLRSGTVGPDVAVLAGRVAGSLDQTPEGASLRASLPTLRRAAGLCARCAQPYTGIADACPACLAGVPARRPHPPRWHLEHTDTDRVPRRRSRFAVFRPGLDSTSSPVERDPESRPESIASTRPMDREPGILPPSVGASSTGTKNSQSS